MMRQNNYLERLLCEFESLFLIRMLLNMNLHSPNYSRDNQWGNLGDSKGQQLHKDKGNHSLLLELI